VSASLFVKLNYSYKGAIEQIYYIY